MSKKISLFFIVEDIVITCKRLTVMLEKCCEAGNKVFHIEFTFKDIEANNLFTKKIIEAEQALKKRFKFTANYTLACRNEQLRGLRLRGHAKKRFNIKSLSDDTVQLHTFSDWLFSKNGVEIRYFTDLLKLILIKERSGCEYNSCLGNVLSIDGSGVVYWCKHNKLETALEHIDEFKTLSDFFNNGQFEKYLDTHYQKREYCKSKCIRYDLCIGGCPLKCDTSQNAKCTEQNFLEVIDHVSNELRHGIEHGDLSLLNKHARTIILNAIAFAPFSDFFQDLTETVTVSGREYNPDNSLKNPGTSQPLTSLHRF